MLRLLLTAALLLAGCGARTTIEDASGSTGASGSTTASSSSGVTEPFSMVRFKPPSAPVELVFRRGSLSCETVDQCDSTTLFVAFDPESPQHDCPAGCGTMLSVAIAHFADPQVDGVCTGDPNTGDGFVGGGQLQGGGGPTILSGVPLIDGVDFNGVYMLIENCSTCDTGFGMCTDDSDCCSQLCDEGMCVPSQ